MSSSHRTDTRCLVGPRLHTYPSDSVSARRGPGIIANTSAQTVARTVFAAGLPPNLFPILRIETSRSRDRKMEDNHDTFRTSCSHSEVRCSEGGTIVTIVTSRHVRFHEAKSKTSTSKATICRRHLSHHHFRLLKTREVDNGLPRGTTSEIWWRDKQVSQPLTLTSILPCLGNTSP